MKASTTFTMAISLPMAVLGLEFTEMFVPYGAEQNPQEKDGYAFDDGNRQHFHIMRPADATDPTPVVLWAHGNGGTASNFNEDDLAVLDSVGYALISWESVTPLREARDSQTAMEDLELLFEWMETNKEAHNLDTSKVIIGGRSRGTGISWAKAHSGDERVIGIYMYGAIPDPAWENLEESDPRSVVNVNSPPARFLYAAVCPKPITDECSPEPYDIHNPKNGQKINVRYGELGIGDKFGLTDGNPKTEKFVPFPAFAECLEKDGMDCLPEHDPAVDNGESADEDPDDAASALKVPTTMMVSLALLAYNLIM